MSKLKPKIVVNTTAGVISVTRERSIIKSVSNLIQEMRKHKFYLSENILQTVLDKAGEI